MFDSKLEFRGTWSETAIFSKNLQSTRKKEFARSSERSCERKFLKKSTFFRKIFFPSSEKLTFEKENLLPAITASLQNNNLFEFSVSDYLDRCYRLGQSHAFFLGVHFGHIKHYLNIVK